MSRGSSALFNSLKSALQTAPQVLHTTHYASRRTLTSLTKVPSFNYIGENLIFKFKVLSNLDNLIEDDRKADFFTLVVEKYGLNSIKKVQICAKEVLKQLEERTFKAKVREELIVALQNPNQSQ